MNNKTSLTKQKPEKFKLTSWNKLKYLNAFKLGNKSKAAVILDKNRKPQLFLLNTYALLDVLSKIDDALVDKLSTEEYHSKSVNPAGWLIDEIESNLPISADFVMSLKRSIAEANKKGWIPFSEI